MNKIAPKTRRLIVGLFVIALMIFSLAFHSGIGTPSSFGIGEFFLLCPLGGLEALLASKTFIPQTLISLVVVVVICLVIGRAWCSWGCPVPLTRRLFGIKERRPKQPSCKRNFIETFKSDSRLWVLLAIIIAVLIVGIPVFCLVCPVGLVFGTIMSVWRLIQFSDLNWGLLVFPAALVVELVLCRTWCIRICPIAGLLSIIGRFARPFRPIINESTCLQFHGEECNACHNACPASIDLHEADATSQLADCTRCMECKGVCPTSSITMPFVPKRSDRNGREGTRPAAEMAADDPDTMADAPAEADITVADSPARQADITVADAPAEAEPGLQN